MHRVQLTTFYRPKKALGCGSPWTQLKHVLSFGLRCSRQKEALNCERKIWRACLCVSEYQKRERTDLGITIHSCIRESPRRFQGALTTPLPLIIVPEEANSFCLIHFTSAFFINICAVGNIYRPSHARMFLENKFVLLTLFSIAYFVIVSLTLHAHF